jgi:hypothetical protein
MSDARHAIFTNTNLHGITACIYVTIQHGRHTKIYYVTTNNMASARHNSFTNTNLHGGVTYTYVTIQHGRHIKIPFYIASQTLTLTISQLSTHFLTAFFRTEWIQRATIAEWIQLATIFSTITSSPGQSVLAWGRLGETIIP